MSTQLNNSKVPATLSSSTLDSLLYVYATNRTLTGYVISTKQLKGVEPKWVCTTKEDAQAWIDEHDERKFNNDTRLLSTIMNNNNKKALDKATNTSYDVNTTLIGSDIMDITSLSLQELAALQVQIATRINELLLQQSIDNETKQVQVVDVVPASETEQEVEAIESAPSSGEEEVNAPRKLKVKSRKNVEAVAAKIEETLCVLSRPEAQKFIKSEKLPIKANMSCEMLNDAINAWKHGGIECIPTQYLTKSAAEKANKREEVQPSTTKKKVKATTSKK